MGHCGIKVMFIGTFKHKLDNKNRLSMPAKFRNEFGTSCIVTKGLDGCLSVYSESDFQTLMEKLSKIPSTKKEARSFVRAIASKADTCEFDGQGRIQLCNTLMSEGKFEKEVVVVGVGNHVELWAQPLWEAYNVANEASFEEVAESMTDFLI